MEVTEKKIYKALKYYIRHNREALAEIFLTNKKSLIEPELEKRLKNRGYIEHSIVVNQINMHWHDLVITNKGYDKFCELREKYQKDWTLQLTIINIILFVLNLVLLFVK